MGGSILSNREEKTKEGQMEKVDKTEEKAREQD